MSKVAQSALGDMRAQIVGRALVAVPSALRAKIWGPNCLVKQSNKFVTKSMSDPMEWASQDERRMLHAVYRVGNMDDYIKYMQDCFGMKLLRYRDIKEDKYTNAFLGYGSEKTNFALE